MKLRDVYGWKIDRYVLTDICHKQLFSVTTKQSLKFVSTYVI